MLVYRYVRFNPLTPVCAFINSIPSVFYGDFRANFVHWHSTNNPIALLQCCTTIAANRQWEVLFQFDPIQPFNVCTLIYLHKLLFADPAYTCIVLVINYLSATYSS